MMKELPMMEGKDVTFGTIATVLIISSENGGVYLDELPPMMMVMMMMPVGQYTYPSNTAMQWDVRSSKQNIQYYAVIWSSLICFSKVYRTSF